MSRYVFLKIIATHLKENMNTLTQNELGTKKHLVHILGF
jgi:hypothetical protein